MRLVQYIRWIISVQLGIPSLDLENNINALQVVHYTVSKIDVILSDNFSAVRDNTCHCTKEAETSQAVAQTHSAVLISFLY